MLTKKYEISDSSIIYLGDCLSVMPELVDSTIDSVVTDPPYGLNFMDANWDHGIPGVPFWREALRIAKPGAHLVAFNGTKNFHRLTCNIEDAGWEMLFEQAKWPSGGSSVEQGLIEIYKLIQLGQFKIFDHLSGVFEEFSQYHRDDNGKIVKVADDLLDAIRYAYMMRRHAIRKCDIGVIDDDDDNHQDDGKWY